MDVKFGRHAHSQRGNTSWMYSEQATFRGRLFCAFPLSAIYQKIIIDNKMRRGKETKGD